MSVSKISLSDIDLIFFDFDGVLTNNKVFVSETGQEQVCCNRSDGLGFDVLRKLKLPCFIISTEKNYVVTERAKKLKIEVLQDISNKSTFLKSFALANKFNLDRALFVGNDLNDYMAMKLCGYSVCPFDSHNKIIEIANVVLNTKGGEGVVRELLEEVLEIDFIKTLYS
jgi:YrbI family 3-deoxy-D-manno-octulosonate 8-phosphate phosphatase